MSKTMVTGSFRVTKEMVNNFFPKGCRHHLEGKEERVPIVTSRIFLSVRHPGLAVACRACDESGCSERVT